MKGAGRRVRLCVVSSVGADSEVVHRPPSRVSDRSGPVRGGVREKVPLPTPLLDRRIRKELSIEPGKWEIDAQVTPALLEKIDYANTKVGSEVVDGQSQLAKEPPKGYDQVQRDDPPWLKTAFAELAKGVKETSGKSNPEIDKYFRRFGSNLDQQTDWSGALVAWCIANSSDAGMERTLPSFMLDDGSYTSWGEKNLSFEDKIPRGALVLLSRDNSSQIGHSGFFLSKAGSRVWLLGGNIKDSVSISAYPRDIILAIRWMEPLAPRDINVAMPFTARSWDTYKATMGSSIAITDGYKSVNKFGALGRYQFAAPGLWSTGYVKKGAKTSALKDSKYWTGKNGIKSVGDWLRSPKAQDDALLRLARNNTANVRKRLSAAGYDASRFDMETELLPLLAVAHIFGSGATVDLLTGKKDHTRKDGIKASEIYRDFAIRFGGSGKYPNK